jgi:hypothetical protein
MNDFGDFLLWMLAFYFWFLIIWVFIAVIADIFRRRDVSGWGKAGWIFLVIILPLLGSLIYVLARPKMTEQDREQLMEAEAAQRRATGFSTADELEKLARLHDQGAISGEEYEGLKQRALAY